MSHITPTVGRKVYFYANTDKQREPWDATIIKIVRPEADGDGCVPPDGPHTAVNLSVVHPDTGTHYFEPGVVVGDEHSTGRHYRWMPYQLGQAKREEATPIQPVGTVTYADGTTATGTLPLPATSPGGAPAVEATANQSQELAAQA